MQRLHSSLWSRFSFIEPLQSEKTEGPWAFRQSDPTETEVYFTEVDGSYSPFAIMCFASMAKERLLNWVISNIYLAHCFVNNRLIMLVILQYREHWNMHHGLITVLGWLMWWVFPVRFLCSGKSICCLDLVGLARRMSFEPMAPSLYILRTSLKFEERRVFCLD